MGIKIIEPAKPAVMEFVLDRVGKTGLEVLELCYQDIPREWICGSLTKSCILNGHKKPLGCAMGLVGMNAGLGMFGIEHHNDGTISVTCHEFREDIVRDPVAFEACMCLALAIPERHVEITLDWEYLRKNNIEQLNKNLSKLREEWETAPDAVNSMIVSYNDSSEMTRAQAAGWFCNAIGIAESREWNRQHPDATVPILPVQVKDIDDCGDPNCTECHPENN